MKIAAGLRIILLPFCCLLAGCVFDTPPNVLVQDVSVSAVGEGSPAAVELGIDLSGATLTGASLQV